MSLRAHDRKPRIGVISDRRILDPHPFHIVGEKYLTAVSSVAGGIPLGIPVLGDYLSVAEFLKELDGLLLTGSYSNMEPYHYGQDPVDEVDETRDPARDSSALTLIEAALQQDIPLLAICRGFEELNVAHGGTLHQNLTAAGFSIHKENPEDPLEIQYGPRHQVEFVSGGLLERLAGSSQVAVNSVHGQGVAALGKGLVVEAVAEDGLIEAVTVQGARFAVGVQWHPEWQVEASELSTKLFAAFGAACQTYGKSRE